MSVAWGVWLCSYLWTCFVGLLEVLCRFYGVMAGVNIESYHKCFCQRSCLAGGIIKTGASIKRTVTKVTDYSHNE